MANQTLVRRLSLTRATVTGMIGDVMARGLVLEIEAAEQASPREVGRPGIDIGLDPSGAYFLGVEIGIGVLRFSLLDLAAGVTETEEIALRNPTPPDEVVALIAQKLTALRSVPRCRQAIKALGGTVPGLARNDGHVINLPILGWRDMGLGALIADRINLPCQAENNANAAAFGHMYSRPRVDHGVAVYLKIGNGCGGAVIIDDKLLRGSNGLGTEFGHLRIAMDGPLCSCGQRGCLETFINLKALQRYLTGEDVDATTVGPELPTHVAALLEAGDPAAGLAIARLAEHLAHGLVDITNILNPDEVVIGGAMTPVLDAVLDRARVLLAAGIVQGMSMPTLTISRIGTFECAIGAAALAHHEAFGLTNLDLRG
ncbi:MAG: ROK family protein [Candidatus Devosia euplotis]|nr:ROK family protein [Candidatus Devosia euplotis]